MARLVRVTGAWTQLLADWLDAEGLLAPDIRVVLDSRAPDEAVPLPAWCRLLERAAALRPALPAPGLSIGARVQPRHVGVLGYIAAASSNLGEAMLAYRRYERLLYGVDAAETGPAGRDIEIRWRADASFGLLVDSVSIAALVSFIRRQVEGRPALSFVSFVPAPPEDPEVLSAFESFFECPVHFGDSHTRVRLPAQALALPMRHQDAELRALLDRQGQALLAAIPGSDDFERALQRVALRLLPDGTATLARAARDLHLSARTLQRRLDQRGLSWQQFLDRLREQLARQYLADRSLGLDHIAFLLGYSEQSAFNRAFRRWTGATPASLRKRLNAPNADTKQGRRHGQ